MRVSGKNGGYFGGLLALGILGATTAPVHAAFTKFDDFDTYPAGNTLGGQGPAGNTWTVSATAGASTNVLNIGGSNNVANPLNNSIPNYRLLPAGQTVTNASTSSTVFWTFVQALSSNTPAGANNWNFIVTDVPTPDTAGTSEVQFNYDSTQAPAGGTTTWRIRNGGAFVFASTDGTAAGRINPQAGVQYNVWFVINNSTDTYKVFMQSSGDPALASVTQMKSDAGVTDFGFRNGAAANDLTTINFGNGSTAAGNGIQFDNIYVDTAGQNLANPVPEPATFGLLGGGALMLLGRRRRQHR